MLTEDAVGFIRESKDKPFLLYFANTTVHTPIHPGAVFAGKSANGRFGDWVEKVDWSVGRVLDPMGKGMAVDASGKGPRLHNLDQEIGEQTFSGPASST